MADHRFLKRALAEFTAITVAVLVALAIAPLFESRWYSSYQLGDMARRLAGGVSLAEARRRSA